MPALLKPLVFVSSTSDLPDDRAAVRDALAEHEVDVYLYEDDVSGTSPRQHLEEILSRTDVYIGLFGGRYGSLLPGSDPEASIVEWEYDQASAREETAVFALQKTDVDSVEAKQARFLQKVQSFDGAWVKPYASIQELKRRVRRAYNRYLNRFYALYFEAGESRARAGQGSAGFSRHLPIVVAIAALALTGLAAATGWLSIVQAFGFVVATTAASGALILFRKQ